MGNIFDQVVHKVTTPVVNTVHAAKQLAGFEPTHQTALRGGAYNQAPKAAANFGYQASPLAPFMSFATNPNASNLLMAMLSSPMGASPAIALGGRSKALRAALGVPNSMRGVKEARVWEDLANKNMLPFTRDIRSQLLNILPDTSKGIEHGKAYRVPAKSQHGVFVNDRTAIIQDPKTGTMFAAPGVIHGDLIKHIREDPNIQGFPTGFEDWLQHEVYSPTDFGTGMGTVPARLMFGGVNGRLDTELATVGRAALVKRMHELGMRSGDTPQVSNIRKALLDQVGPRGADILDEILSRQNRHPTGSRGTRR